MSMSRTSRLKVLSPFYIFVFLVKIRASCAFGLLHTFFFLPNSIAATPPTDLFLNPQSAALRDLPESSSLPCDIFLDRDGLPVEVSNVVHHFPIAVARWPIAVHSPDLSLPCDLSSIVIFLSHRRLSSAQRDLQTAAAAQTQLRQSAVTSAPPFRSRATSIVKLKVLLEVG